MQRTVRVAVENATMGFDREFTYLVPDRLTGAARAGCRCRVPFGRGNQLRTALILDESGGDADSGSLKALDSVLDSAPLLGEEGLLLLRHLKEHTFCTWFDALRLLVPAGAGIQKRVYWRAVAGAQGDGELFGYLKKRGKPVEEGNLLARFGLAADDDTLAGLERQGLVLREEQLAPRIGDDKVCMVSLTGQGDAGRLSPKQEQVVAFLEENGGTALRELCYYTALTRSVVDRLQAKGIVAYHEITRSRNPYAGAGQETTAPLPVLSGQQRGVLRELSAMYRTGEPGTALLYGVTGSGKTEVFLSLIQEVLEAGRQVVVMVPEISLTAQTLQVFHSRFGGKVAVLHSGLSMGERLDEWRRIRDGEASIAVGTRSAVFAPFGNLGLIVMDEEQEHTYKSEKSPRFHARDIAKVRCTHHKALLLLASATPSIETYYQAKQGRYKLLTLDERFGEALLPDVYVVDLSRAEVHSASPSLSNTLLEELRYNLDHEEQSILLLNRRGYSTLVKCSQCGDAVQCPHCSVSMTYHAANDSLLCHYCGFLQAKSARCPQCSSELVRYSGAGTQKVQEELQALYPDARILRMDMDTTLAKFSHEKMFDAFLKREYDIMIGTQMVAKGLNFPHVTLVGVLQADQALYAPDFRSYERAFSLLTQVVGRSGRGERRGRAFIQTYFPENPVIELASHQNYPGFYAGEIRSRRLHLYPPFCAMAGIGFTGEKLEEVSAWSGKFLVKFRETAAASYGDLPIRVLGPAPADTLKAAGKYRYRMIVKCRNNRRTRQLFREVRDWFLANCKTVGIFVDMYYDRI